MQSAPSTFAQIVDKIRLMNEGQQKLLWLQLNQDAIYTAAAKTTPRIRSRKVSMSEIAKLTTHVRDKKKKT